MPPSSRAGAATADLAWLALALAVFGSATGALYAPVWREDAREVIPSRKASRALAPVVRNDHRFVVWAVARNARTLAVAPWQLFDAEGCFPDERTLALGEPVVAMGLYGLPMCLATDDPVLVYNLVLFAMTLSAALAMYWLVVCFTGVPAAGIVAGLLYAFSSFRLLDPVHPYSADTTPMVLSLLFATRLFATHRWRYAVGLAASISLQAATSFYPLIASAAVGAPFAVWLLLTQSSARSSAAGRSVPWPHLACVIAASGLSAWFVLGPYLEMREAGGLRTVVQDFGALSEHLPGGSAFFGGFGAVLALVGALAPRRLAVDGIARDPRLALAAGGLLAALLAAGPHAPLDLYGALAHVLPGFDTVRLPRKLMIGVPLVASVLAGFGVAAITRRAAQRSVLVGRAVAAFSLVAACGFMLGTPPHYTTFVVRPPDHAIAFYAALADERDTGPIFETPLPYAAGTYGWGGTSAVLLLSYFHEQRTSACYPSHPQPHRSELEDIESRLPSRAAVDDLARLGFTTIVLHQPPARVPHPTYRERFMSFAATRQSGLAVTLTGREHVAFEIRAR